MTRAGRARGGLVAGLFAALLGAAAAVGCGGEQKAAELFSTAEFEERQFNRDHARELYLEIIQRYPDSEFAAKARARLQTLDQAK